MIAASTLRNILVVRARVAGALRHDARVERFGYGLAQHFDDAEIDAAGAHDFVADVRREILEQAGMSDRHDAFARSQRQLPDEALRYRGVVERQLRLCDKHALRRAQGERETNDGARTFHEAYGTLIGCRW